MLNFVNIIKFIHLLATLGLLGLTVYCLSLSLSKQFASQFTNPNNKLARLNRVLLLCCVIGIGTGLLLVYPKHFTFHTPWIDAAITLMLTVAILLTSIVVLNTKIPVINRWLSVLLYSSLIFIFLIVIHDAINKTTMLFP